MSLNPDDPRLTAYALGEMSEKECAAFEAELKESPECRAAVEEIQRTAKFLSDELASESAATLSSEQRETIQTRVQAKNVIRLPDQRRFMTVSLAALAACAMGIIAWQIWFAGSAKLQRTAKLESPRLDFIPASVPETVPSLQPPPAKSPDATSPNQTEAPVQILTLSGSAAPSFGADSSGFAGSLNRQSSRSGEEKKDALLSSGVTVPRASASGQLNGQSGSGGSGERLSLVGLSTVAGNKQVISVNVVGYTDAGVEDEKLYYGDRFFRLQDGRTDTASYPHLVENAFQSVRNQPLSTFSIDVDTASYANVRRFLKEGQRPPRDAVRIEEMINYFTYHYSQPHGNDPFSANIEVAGCPWNSEHRLVRIGIKGREIARANRPPSNFVFLIDVSGSMQPQERLPLIKEALRQLVKKMNEHDRVAIVVYASEAGLKLESTPCSEKEKILQAIDELGAGGSTNGGDGIRQAYRVAQENFIEGGVNRVLLCTDGDFNVGMTDQGELVRIIQQKAKSGVFLTTLGVGTDNYKDALMQKLADKGNGNYHYLDTQEEAQKVLIDQMNGTLVTIAKDVKLQVEFNPAQVGAYRLIGYEKRMLRKEDFNNDAKDAGEIGAGHSVTALYEIVPAGREIPSAVDDLKYQQPADEKPDRYVTRDSKELLTLKIRYKQPDGDRSRLLEFPVTDSGKRFNSASKDFQFAAAVASFGMLLRDSEYKGNSSYHAVLECAQGAKGPDEEGYRAEFISLVQKARQLK